MSTKIAWSHLFIVECNMATKLIDEKTSQFTNCKYCWKHVWMLTLRVIYWRNSILRNKLKKCTYNKQQFSFYRPFQIPEGLWSLLDSPELFHCLWVSGQRSVYWLLSYFLCYRLIWPQTYESMNQTYIQLIFYSYSI